jgi:hypothetical protein
MFLNKAVYGDHLSKWYLEEKTNRDRLIRRYRDWIVSIPFGRWTVLDFDIPFSPTRLPSQFGIGEKWYDLALEAFRNDMQKSENFASTRKFRSENCYVHFQKKDDINEIRQKIRYDRLEDTFKGIRLLGL